MLSCVNSLYGDGNYTVKLVKAVEGNVNRLTLRNCIKAIFQRCNQKAALVLLLT